MNLHTSIPHVDECMSRQVVTIPRNLSIADARQRMFNHHIRHLPVMEDGHVVGIVSERDLNTLRSLSRKIDPDQMEVSTAMVSNPYICHPDTPLDEVVETLANHKIGCALVTDQGKLVGVFSVIDGLKQLVRMLRKEEEIPFLEQSLL